MSKPHPKRTEFTQGEKAAILFMRSQHIPYRVIAERLGRSERGVQDVVRRMRARADEDVEGYNYKDDLKDRAISAVMDGLNADEDPYKRGTLGVSVLKGLGELQPDGSIVQLNQLINSVPPDMRHRYFVETEVVK